MTIDRDLAALAGLTERSVSSCGAHRTIRMSRMFGFTPHDTWEAVTDPRRLRRWIGEVTGDLREGGQVRLAMPTEGSGVASLTIVRCDPPRRLTMQWSRPGEDRSLVDVELQPSGVGETRLLLEHVRLDERGATEYGAGWEDFLVRLDTLLVQPATNAAERGSFQDRIAPLWRDALLVADRSREYPELDVQPTGIAVDVQREIAAPPAAVWAALTDPALMTRWFAVVSGELRVGGAWRADFDGGTARGTVERCTPEELIVTSWSWDHDGDLPASTVTVTLAAHDDGTTVAIRQAGVLTPAKGYSAGWYAYLRALDAEACGQGARRADWQADWERAMTLLRD